MVEVIVEEKLKDLREKIGNQYVVYIEEMS